MAKWKYMKESDENFKEELIGLIDSEILNNFSQAEFSLYDS